LMAVKVEERNGWLCYRIYFDGWKGRESTRCRATEKNRARLERKAQVMSDLMAEGRFAYLDWFPDGNRAVLYRPAPASEPVVPPTVGQYATMWLARMTPPAVRRSLEKTYKKHLKGHILPRFQEQPLDRVTTPSLLDFRGELTRAEGDGGRGLKMKT